MSCTNCNNNQAETNTNYLPDPCVTGCVDIAKGECTTYTGATTSCLAIPSGTTLNTVIQTIDTAICMLSEDRFSEYDLGCLETLTIATEEDFAEKLATLLCQILGSESPVAPVSLSTLKSNITAIQGTLNAQAIISCYQALGSLGTTASVTALLTSLQTVLCAVETRTDALETAQLQLGKVKVSAQDTTFDYLNDKIVSGDMIAIDLVNVGADESMSVRFDFNAFVAYINANPAAKIALNAALA